MTTIPAQHHPAWCTHHQDDDPYEDFRGDRCATRIPIPIGGLGIEVEVVRWTAAGDGTVIGESVELIGLEYAGTDEIPSLSGWQVDRLIAGLQQARGLIDGTRP